MWVQKQKCCQAGDNTLDYVHNIYAIMSEIKDEIYISSRYRFKNIIILPIIK